MYYKNEFRCDAEIGRPNPMGIWHTCKRKAVVQCHNPKYGIYLHFCERHQKRATEHGRVLDKTLSAVTE